MIIVIMRQEVAYEDIVWIIDVVYDMHNWILCISFKQNETLCKGVTLALFDWILYILMYYTQLYTGLFEGVIGVKAVMVLYSSFDTVELVANTWTHKVFTIERIQGDIISCNYVVDSWIYKAHFLYTYIVMIMLLTAFAFEIA